jgi:hypothetical protein
MKFSNIADLEQWIFWNVKGSTTKDQVGEISRAIRQMSNRPTFLGDDWTEFLSSLPALESLIPEDKDIFTGK